MHNLLRIGVPTKGLILSAAVCDAQGVQKDVFEWGEVLKILIKVHIPKDISREHLSIAFSIKDLKGTDLIVSTQRTILNADACLTRNVSAFPFSLPTLS